MQTPWGDRGVAERRPSKKPGPRSIAGSVAQRRSLGGVKAEAALAERQFRLSLIKSVGTLLLGATFLGLLAVAIWKFLGTSTPTTPAGAVGSEQLLVHAALARVAQQASEHHRSTVSRAEVAGGLASLVKAGLVAPETAREALTLVMQGGKEVAVHGLEKWIDSWFNRSEAPPVAPVVTPVVTVTIPPGAITCAPVTHYRIYANARGGTGGTGGIGGTGRGGTGGAGGAGGGGGTGRGGVVVVKHIKQRPRPMTHGPLCPAPTPRVPKA
jgi:uncharacterized membrane protein YgcG